MKFFAILTVLSLSSAASSKASTDYDCSTAPCLAAASILTEKCGDEGVTDSKCACGLPDSYFIALYDCSKDCKGLQIDGYTGPNDYKNAYCLQASQSDYVHVSAAGVKTSAQAAKTAEAAQGKNPNGSQSSTAANNEGKETSGAANAGASATASAGSGAKSVAAGAQSSVAGAQSSVAGAQSTVVNGVTEKASMTKAKSMASATRNGAATSLGNSTSMTQGQIENVGASTALVSLLGLAAVLLL
ncbi:PGA28 Probable GPI-anchored adhesin-like protein PGA28 [Candida maltosa Xu316]|uniref:Extracellular membrane protein CFEM domain-containing protein n=1 Tax=Candida maltosa (strain Xu316) TaxID=1245528 RepID=M3JXI4_CANMX|nr:hypothetical protein G210_1935 [Candida maltosa Xu316]